MSRDGSAILPWQQDQYAKLVQQLAEGQLGHAYLLQGPAGIGKRQFARCLAQRLLCSQPAAGQPCQACSSCQLFRAGTHPDLKWLAPEDKSRVIKIEQVRETVDFMAKTSNQGGYKVAILAPVESLNVNAANALLKTLEEPPQRTLLLLVSHQPGLVMATIRSRCQSLAFGIPSPGQAVEWLNQQHIAGSPQVLLALADGAPLKALALGDEQAMQQRTQVHACLLGLRRGELSIVEAAQVMQEGQLDATLELMMFCVHDLLRVLQSGGQVELKDPDMSAMLPLLGEGLDSADLHAFYHELLGLKRALVRNSNPNPRLTLEALLYTWSSLGRPVSA